MWMKMGSLVVGWIELVAVDGGCKRSEGARYLKAGPREVVD